MHHHSMYNSGLIVFSCENALYTSFMHQLFIRIDGKRNDRFLKRLLFSFLLHREQHQYSSSIATMVNVIGIFRRLVQLFLIIMVAMPLINASYDADHDWETRIVDYLKARRAKVPFRRFQFSNRDRTFYIPHRYLKQ